MTALALLLPILTGCGVMSHAIPAWRYRPQWLGYLLLVSTGTIAGLGIHSLLFFALLWTGAASTAVLWFVDIVVAAISVALAWKFRSAVEPVVTVAPPPRHWRILAGAAVLATVLTAGAVIGTSLAQTYGDYDAWAMWNLKAKYLAAPGSIWRMALSPDQSFSSPEYPLLVPASTARIWRLTGETSQDAPLALGLVFFFAVEGILFAALATLRGWGAALLAMLTLAASASFVSQGSAQYSDVPLSAFMLAALALSLWREDAPSLASAGLLLSCAAWTKNEGLVFFAIAVLGIALFRGIGRLGWVLAGSAPGMTLVILFKLLLAPSSRFAGQSVAQMAGKATDLSRWSVIGSGFLTQVENLGMGIANPLLLLAAITIGLGFDRKAPWRLPALVLPLQFASYLGAYLITPLDMQYQVFTSFERLIAQIWPSLLFTCFLAFRRPEELLPQPEAPVAATAKPSSKRSKKPRG